MRVRSATLPVALAFALNATAQRLDSVHVFRSPLAARCNTAKAEANAWLCHRSHTPFLSIGGAELEPINQALSTARANKHNPGQLEVAGLGFGYANGAMHAFAITAGAEKVVDLTTRREFMITDLSDRLELKALLLTLGL
jgi:hypothetical protein